MAEAYRGSYAAGRGRCENDAGDVFQRSENKKSSRPGGDPEDCTRFFILAYPQPTRERLYLSRQVFWLVVHPTPRAFPSNRTVVLAGFVPTYSGGTAREFHPLPLPGSHVVAAL